MNKINLPTFNSIKENESTYYTFSKALLDLDKSIANNTEYYFSKAVAISLPDWKAGEFFKNEQINIDTVTDSSTNNPQAVIPNYFARYLENIIRQDIHNPRITEIAFWKTLEVLLQKKLTIPEIQKKHIKVINNVVISDFYELKNNNGWGKIIVQIPNTTKGLAFEQRQETIETVQSTDEDQLGLYDNSFRQFEFNNVSTIDFTSVREQPRTEPIEFNAILLFYKDSEGIDKLHGINFVYPWVLKGTEYRQTPLLLNNNSIGYQFIFNVKTCNNEATIERVLENNEHMNWWNGFETTFNKLNTLLELKINESRIIHNDFI